MTAVNIAEMPPPAKLVRQAERNHDALIRLTVDPARKLLPLWSADYPEDTFTPAAVQAAGQYLDSPDLEMTREISSELTAAYNRLWRHAYIAATPPDA
jgi:hypothetical protein